MKIYTTHVIREPKFLGSCPVFTIEHAQWTNVVRPKTFGHMGYILGRGLYVRMFTDEKNPYRKTTEHMVNVCQDSVMEGFFAFPDLEAPLDPDGRPSDNGLYFNFEINPNGALYANIGRGRKGRQSLLPKEFKAASPKAWVNENGNGWGAEFIVPETLIKRFHLLHTFTDGGAFFCNFYKMSENKENEHYISYHPISSDTPNFHLPSSFARTVVKEEPPVSSSLTIEICCNSAEDVFTAAKAGADRVELNSAVLLGGLTPGIGSVSSAVKANIPVLAMLRPREGGFCYSDIEFESMLSDAKALINAGASGIVFGVLLKDGTVDKKRCAKLVEAAGEADCVFHRAIDVTPDWRAAIDILCEIGIKRVLTSGQAKTAIEGAAVIQEMIDYAAGRIEILPGGGIRAENAAALLEMTGAAQLHVSMSKAAIDRSCSAKPFIRFCADTPLDETGYRATDEAAAREFIDRFKYESVTNFTEINE